MFPESGFTAADPITNSLARYTEPFYKLFNYWPFGLAGATIVKIRRAIATAIVAFV
jgi:hypothetical protein